MILTFSSFLSFHYFFPFSPPFLAFPTLPFPFFFLVPPFPCFCIVFRLFASCFFFSGFSYFLFFSSFSFFSFFFDLSRLFLVPVSFCPSFFSFSVLVILFLPFLLSPFPFFFESVILPYFTSFMVGVTMASKTFKPYLFFFFGGGGEVYSRQHAPCFQTSLGLSLSNYWATFKPNIYV